MYLLPNFRTSSKNLTIFLDFQLHFFNFPAVQNLKKRFKLSSTGFLERSDDFYKIFKPECKSSQYAICNALSELVGFEHPCKTNFDAPQRSHLDWPPGLHVVLSGVASLAPLVLRKVCSCKSMKLLRKVCTY